ncbi:MAG: hypothetical protein GY705_13465 [Bacteroidetes bacterium]|nr:hypothetical protein [Bacteroidota bacterium]
MNGYTRINTVLNGQWPDQRPIMLHNFMPAAREAGYSMKTYCTDSDAVVNAHIQAVEKYELDGIVLDIDTAVLAHAVGVPVDFPEFEPARAHGKCIKSLEVVPDLEPPDLSKNERVIIALEAAVQLKQYFGDEIFLRGNCDQAPFSLAAMMRSMGDWMMDLLMENEHVFDLLEYCTHVCLQFVDLMASTGVHMISNGDSPAGPDLISPEMYRKFALPYEKKVVERVHAHGLPYMLHICGDTLPILPYMPLSQLDSVELDYKTDIKSIHEMYKDKIVFSGNIDPSGVMAIGSPKMIEEKLTELLTIYEDSPRLILNAGCALPYSTPEENIRKFIQVVRS